MIKVLKNSHVTPPGGWRFVDPTTGFEFNERYRNLPQLLQHIRDYRAQNKLAPIPSLQIVVENWLCHQPNMERYSKSVPAVRGIQQYLQGAKAYAKAKLAVEQDEYLTSKEEAEVRAKICTNCFHNEIPKEKSKLAELADVKIQELVGDRTTSLDRGLFMCSICTCPLRAKVHFAQDFVEKNMEPKMQYLAPNGLPGRDGKPLYCWQLHPVRTDGRDSK